MSDKIQTQWIPGNPFNTSNPPKDGDLLVYNGTTGLWESSSRIITTKDISSSIMIKTQANKDIITDSDKNPDRSNYVRDFTVDAYTYGNLVSISFKGEYYATTKISNNNDAMIMWKLPAPYGGDVRFTATINSKCFVSGYIGHLETSGSLKDTGYLLLYPVGTDLAASTAYPIRGQFTYIKKD